MHGDQLFEEHARNVQWTFRVGNDAFERLEGLTTEFADWHAKVTLYKACEAYATENADVSFRESSFNMARWGMKTLKLES